MTKTFSKELADEIGYGNATYVAAVATDTLIDMARINATREAQGLPTLEEEEAEVLDVLIEQLEASELDNDPEMKQEAIEAKAERDARVANSDEASKRG